MKKTILTLMMASIAYISMAQRADSLLKNTIGMSLLSPVNAAFEFLYERKLGNNRSVIIMPGLTLDNNDGYEAKGFSTEIQYRLGAMSEIRILRYAFFAPFMKYQYVQVNGSDNTSASGFANHDFNNLRMGTMVGLRNSGLSRVYIEGSIGCGVNYAIGSDGTTYQLRTMTLGQSRIFSRANITVGIAF